MRTRHVKRMSKAIGLQSRSGDLAMFKSVKLRQALGRVLDAAVAVTRAQYGSLQLIHPVDRSLRIVAHHGFSDEALQFFRVVKDDLSSCHAALKMNRRTVVPDVRSSALFTEPARRVMLGANLRACQSTPIRSRDGRLLGMISTHFRARHRPTKRQLRRMDLLAGYAALLVENFSQSAGKMDPQAILDEHRDALIEIVAS